MNFNCPWGARKKKKKERKEKRKKEETRETKDFVSHSWPRHAEAGKLDRPTGLKIYRAIARLARVAK